MTKEEFINLIKSYIHNIKLNHEMDEIKLGYSKTIIYLVIIQPNQEIEIIPFIRIMDNNITLIMANKQYHSESPIAALKSIYNNLCS